MDYDTLRLETDERGVATLTFIRGDQHNAISTPMMDELLQANEQIRNDDRIRVVVLTGEGKSFCAGADLGWMKEQFAASREQRIEQASRFASIIDAYNTLPKPLIGRIQGQAFGGGLGLICICDIAITVPEAKFGLTETRLGIVPATIGPYVLARLGEGNARRIFMSARIFGTNEAQELGLVARVVGSNELDSAVEAEVTPYLACSPAAVASSKALARSLGPVIDQSEIDRVVRLLADTWETPDAQEGITAFFEKRKPDWNRL
ncbi:MAG: crotonase/enoyl-CoA hydratase family protein [Methyloligellaceae bacterium]